MLTWDNRGKKVIGILARTKAGGGLLTKRVRGLGKPDELNGVLNYFGFAGEARLAPADTRKRMT